MNVTDSSSGPSRLKPGLSLPIMIALSLLAVPRVVLHDLGIIEQGTLVNSLFVFVPPLIWVVFVVLKQIRAPFLTLLIIGGCYGVFLAIGHQLLWDINLQNQPLPSLGGNLSDLSPFAQSMIFRVVTVFSSLITGLVVGAICGLLAWLISRITRARRPVDAA